MDERLTAPDWLRIGIGLVARAVMWLGRELNGRVALIRA
jgi:hypothetical protein